MVLERVMSANGRLVKLGLFAICKSRLLIIDKRIKYIFKDYSSILIPLLEFKKSNEVPTNTKENFN